MFPAAFVCEGVVMLRNIPYFEESERFTLSLPNSVNMAFHFPSLLRAYLLFLFFPMLYTAMNRMYHLRWEEDF
jgi:very-long-chain (3R)-3-hydroxyacyl-CoA dehydratase